MNIADLRIEYLLKTFDEKDVLKDPFNQFELWLEEALEINVKEQTAMTLSTAKPDGMPSSRIVLLKSFSEIGFVFYGNYESSKGIEIEKNQKVSLLFFWSELQRQVRVEGTASKISSHESDEYFQSRPHGSKIGAHASPQSKIIPDRNFIESEFKRIEKKFEGKNIPRPENWGGYLVEPIAFEFWQGRESRLHDRFLFSKTKDNIWQIDRLAP